jgi:hypothetical protein
MNMSRSWWIVLLLGSWISTAYSELAHPLTTPEEEHSLLMAAMPPTIAKLPGLVIVPPQTTSGLLFYTVCVPRKPNACDNIGQYIIDTSTADIWDGKICHEYKNPKLSKLQKAIRKRIGLTPAEYRKGKRRRC